MRGDAGVGQEGRAGLVGQGRMLWSRGSVTLPAVSNDHLGCSEAFTHTDHKKFHMKYFASSSKSPSTIGLMNMLGNDLA